MDAGLSKIIEAFNAAQRKAVEVLEFKFMCEKPASQGDFIFRCAPAIREANYSAGGYSIRPHGIGMEVEGNGLSIDFDFGENGEFNGFDAFRLYNFSGRNHMLTSLAAEEGIEAALGRAIETGEVVQGQGMGSVYYVQNT